MVLLGQESAAHGRLHAQDVQEVVASLNAEDPLGRARAGQVHAWSAHVGDASEDVVLVVIRHVGGRYAAAVVGIVALVLVERHQPFRARIGQRRSSTASMTLKMALFTPIPKASVITATMVNPACAAEAGRHRSEERRV